MTLLTKILLAAALAGLAVGFATNFLWKIGLPLGAVCLGLFLISKILERESALYDQEHRMRLALAEKNTRKR